MGSFDYIHCLYPLPVKDIPSELKSYDFNKLSYQTKDLDQGFSDYTIHADGTITRKGYEYESRDSEPEDNDIFAIGRLKVSKEWDEVQDITRSLTFYTSIRSNEGSFDYWLSFKASFVKGKIISLELDQFESTDNSRRKQLEREFEEEAAAHLKRQKKWYYRYLYTPYAFIVKRCFRLYHKLKGKIPPAYVVERILLPW